jgi:hypothetical protein
MPCISDKLRIARMIDRFHPDYLLHQSRVVQVNVLDEFDFGVCRAGNKNRTGVGDGLRHGMKKVVILRRMAGPDGIRLMVNVPGRIVRVQYEPFGVGRAEMENARFMMVDPDNRVKVMRGHRI